MVSEVDMAPTSSRFQRGANLAQLPWARSARMTNYRSPIAKAAMRHTYVQSLARHAGHAQFKELSELIAPDVEGIIAPLRMIFRCHVDFEPGAHRGERRFDMFRFHTGFSFGPAREG